MTDDSAFFLDEASTTYSSVTTRPFTAAPSTSSSAAASTAINLAAPSASSSLAASITIIGAAGSTPSSAPAPAQPNQTTGSHHFTDHEKIGVGIGIVAFVIVCCCVAGYALKFYRQKRRAAHPNPSELYFNTDGKGQASGTQL